MIDYTNDKWPALLFLELANLMGTMLIILILFFGQGKS